MKYFSLVMLLVLSACGGGGSSLQAPSQTPTPPVAQCTGSPYLPMCAGTYIRYTVQKFSSAQIASDTNVITVDSSTLTSNFRGKYLTQQFAVHTCPSQGGKLFFANQWNFSDDGLPVTPSMSNDTTLWVSNYTVSSVSYWGEGDGGNIAPGEPYITAHPVVGETFDVHSVVGTSDGNGCSTTPVTNSDFRTTYRTAKRLDSWNGYYNVILTTLIEYTGDSPPSPTIYNYYLADSTDPRNQGRGGMVGFVCHRPQAVDDFYSCGNLYIAVYMGSI